MGSWKNISDGYFGGSIGAIAVAASDPNVIYVGQGEETVRGNVSSGFGLWKSVDAGKTWQHIGLKATRHIGRIRVHPQNPNIVYVGTGSDGLRSNVISGKGVYKSIDAGKTWEHIGLRKTGQIGALEIDPTDNNTVWVAAIGNAFGSSTVRGFLCTPSTKNS